ncbi:hypothetical protein D9M69_631510 [compost metagenome]
MHVVAQIVRIDKACCGPCAIGVWHWRRCDVLFIEEKRFRHIKAIDIFISLAHPMEARDSARIVTKRPTAFGRQIGITAFGQHMILTCKRDGDFAFNDKQHTLRTVIEFRAIAAAAGLHFHNILRESLGKT